MKKPVKLGQIILLAITFFVLGSSLAAANYLRNSSDEDNRASLMVSSQYEEPETEIPVSEGSPDDAEYDNQELDENVVGEDAEDIEQEGEEEYILVDEHGNIIEENSLLEEQEGEVEEGLAEEGGQYYDQNTEEEGVGYIEEGDVFEEGEPEEGEYEVQEEGMEEEVYDPDTGGQEAEEPR